jgi:hypothetical protein
LQIDELAYDGSEAEYIVLANVSQAALSLEGWLIGDAERPGDGEGLYALPDQVLPPGGLFSIARQADVFRSRFGRDPDATIEEAAAPVRRLLRRSDLAHGELALNDGGDEVVLITPNLGLADVAAYGHAEYALLQLWGELRTPPGDSLQRVPGIAYPSTPDLRLRFLSGPPRPFEERGLPLGGPPPPPSLAGGYIGLWGTLGANSSYSDLTSAPPHYMLAAAAAQGLHFTAIADDGVWTPPLSTPQGFIPLSAWRWQGDGGAAAIVYDDRPDAGLSAGALVAHLAETNAPVQWLGEDSPTLRGVAAIAADNSSSESIASLFALWRRAGTPLLLGGNAQPDLPGALTVAPRFTGLAATSASAAALREALAAHRGWLSSDHDAWLTLQAELPGGELRWMGNWIAPANSVTLHVTYGDLSGESAGLAIWQNGAPWHQLLLPPGDGRWDVAVPLVPGAILAAVAIQADGDFVITSPLMVAQADSGIVQVNEVLPAPQQDLDGDGRAGSSDEYVEIWNPGAQPIALGGWQLTDRAGEAENGHRYTFARDALILGGEHLLLWHSTTHLSLDDKGDALRLLDAEGLERDAVAWDETLAPGRSVARIPDGGNWLLGAGLTPGQPNRTDDGSGDDPGSGSGSGPGNEQGSGSGSGGDSRHETHDAFPAVATLEPTYGQAGGPPGSVAQAKLAGLEASVEFEAVVTVPPGLFNNSIYVADAAGDGQTAGIGANVYLSQGDFPPLVEGDRVRLRGRWHSFRGEMELVIEGPQGVWKLQEGRPLAALPVWAHMVCESVEGRLVTFDGLVSGWQGDSLLLVDPSHPASAPLRVTVRSSLAWKRPYVHKGEIWHVTGVVSQFARKRPWNDGYRVLVRYPQDLQRVEQPSGQ